MNERKRIRIAGNLAALHSAETLLLALKLRVQRDGKEEGEEAADGIRARTARALLNDDDDDDDDDDDG